MRIDPRIEWNRCLAAIQLLTRIPVRLDGLEPDWLARAAKYFPLVGLGVGLVAAAVMVAACQLWPQPLPALLAVAATLLLTGALHEDGLADSADGLGGLTREARLSIMKDSRLGTFGALALGLVIAIRVAALAAMPLAAAGLALLGAHAGGRLASVLVMSAQPYAGRPQDAKLPASDPTLRPREIALAALFGLAPALAAGVPAAFAGTAVAGAAAGIAALRLCRPLGGHTGDTLGAVEAIYETGFLLGAAALSGLAP